MVLLENVDISKLNLGNFRKFNCLCELCDCGCFQRAKLEHHKDCKKKKVENNTHRKLSHSSLGCPLSHYRDTFKAHLNHRPPSACLPPPENYSRQYTPMDLKTMQKLEFKRLPMTERTKSYKIEEKYIPPSKPFDAKSKYQEDFKPIVGQSVAIVKKNANEATLVVPSKKFVGQSTTKEHFKGWSDNTNITHTYSELPSYAGYALFPTSERNFATTTSTTHKEFKNVPVTKPFLKNESTSAQIIDKGKMDFETVNRETYIKHENAERAQLADPQGNQNVISNPIPMKSISQTRHDYIFYANHKPPSIQFTNPYDSNLNEIVYPGNIHDLKTIYSTQYKGHDVIRNPQAKSFKKEPPPYIKPTEKIDGLTVTMRDFPGIDVTKIPKLNIIKAKPNLIKSITPMDFQTTAQKHFVQHEVKPPMLAKDPIQQVYIAPKEKFESSTTNREQFYPKKAEKVYSLKPEINNISISGKMDLTSQYRNEFVNHGLTMCEVKAYLLAEAMNKQQQSIKI